MKLIIAVGLLLPLAQQQKENPDLRYDPKMGISVVKPPKNDEWDFKEKGFFTNTKLALNHKVDELGFDIMFQAPASNGGSYDLKKVAEDAFNNMSSQEGVTDAKRVEMKQTKMAMGATAWYLEMTFKRADKLTEFRQWSFIGRENQYLYMIVLHGDEGMYRKHQKVADFILGNLRTWKIPKN
jgi:hypothetical protein